MFCEVHFCAWRNSHISLSLVPSLLAWCWFLLLRNFRWAYEDTKVMIHLLSLESAISNFFLGQLKLMSHVHNNNNHQKSVKLLKELGRRICGCQISYAQQERKMGGEEKIFISNFPPIRKHLELSWHNKLPYGASVTCVNFVRIKRVWAISTSMLWWEFWAPYGCRDTRKIYTAFLFFLFSPPLFFFYWKKQIILHIKLKSPQKALLLQTKLKVALRKQQIMWLNSS